MYPTFHDELRRQQVQDLWRLADEARREGKVRARKRRVRRALGVSFLRAGVRLGGEDAVCSAGLRPIG